MKNYKKVISRSFAVFLIFTILMSFGVCSHADNIVEKAQKSVVRVFVPGYEGTVIGSGFVVGNKTSDTYTVVTNSHVVEKNINNVYVTEHDANDCIKAEVIYRDPIKDIAVLSLSRKLEARIPIALKSPDGVHKADTVYCIGFPGLSDAASGNDELNSEPDYMTVTQGTVSNPKYMSNNVRYIMTDAIANGGNSGGPLIDANGNAIGINSVIIGDSNYMTLALGMDYVMEALDELDIKYLTDSSNAYIKYVIITVVSAVCAVAIILTLKNISASKGRKIAVRCEAGPLLGETAVGSGVVRVGRQGGNCSMAFPAGTPGVSKEHCEFRCSDGSITVTDLHSSYGTYISNGKRVRAGETVTLAQGDYVLVGSEKVVLSAKLL